MAKKKEEVVVEEVVVETTPEVVEEVVTPEANTEHQTSSVMTLGDRDADFLKRHPNATEGVIYE